MFLVFFLCTPRFIRSRASHIPFFHIVLFPPILSNLPLSPYLIFTNIFVLSCFLVISKAAFVSPLRVTLVCYCNVFALYLCTSNLPFFLNVSPRHCFPFYLFLCTFLQSAGLLKAFGSLDLDVVPAKTRQMSPEKLMDLTGMNVQNLAPGRPTGAWAAAVR